MSCPPLARLEMLAAGESDDPQLSEHVAGCAECRTRLEEIRVNNDLVDRIEAADVSALIRERASSPAQLTEVIDGYAIEEEIHRGGQGVVYRAIQLATNRRVALKVLISGTFATTPQRRRFEREIELVAALEHPNIVTVYDSGVTADERHFLAMQYVDGVTLDEAFSSGGAWQDAGLTAVLELFARICAGVSHAHQHGIIHRDLKPANILIDTDGTPKVLDFGIARPIGDDTSHVTQTSAGTFVGTIACAAPEQLRGDPGLVDVRTDVYALGALLHRMLTGRLPFPVDGDIAEIIRARIEDDPAPPSRWRAVDDDLDTIVLMSLAREKERRYQSAAALQDEIRRYLAGEPIDAKRDSSWYVLRKTLRRYRFRAAVGAAFLVLLVTATIVSFVLYRRARDEAEKVTQINLFLEDTLGSVEASAQHEVTVRELLEEAAQWIDIALSDKPEVEASIRSTLANAWRNLGYLDQAERHAQESLRLRHELFGTSHPEVAKALSVLALIRWDEGELDEAERLFREVVEIREEHLGHDAYEMSFALANLGVLLRDRGDYDEAESCLRRAMSIRRGRAAEHSDVAMCLYNLGTVASARGDAEETRRLHTEALEMRRRVLSPAHPDLARSLFVLGSHWLEAGDPGRAQPLLQECLERRIDALREGHWLIPWTRSALGECVIALGDRERGLALLRSGHDELLAAFGPDDDHVRTARSRLEAAGG